MKPSLPTSVAHRDDGAFLTAFAIDRDGAVTTHDLCRMIFMMHALTMGHFADVPRMEWVRLKPPYSPFNDVFDRCSDICAIRNARAYCHSRSTVRGDMPTSSATRASGSPAK